MRSLKKNSHLFREHARPMRNKRDKRKRNKNGYLLMEEAENSTIKRRRRGIKVREIEKKKKDTWLV